MSSGTEFLKKVSTKINEKIREVEQEIEQGRQEIQDMNDYYWDNYTEMDQYGYENYDNQQALLHQVNANQEQQKMYRRLRRMQDSPFFARVDFQYEGEDAPELFYIGIGNFAEKAGMIPLIYDWRAPVSGLFYDYDCGPASYEAPGGTMEGEICSKWQYKIRRGRMVYEFESEMKIDDEILRQELGQNGDVRLKNIVRTIQKEQNQIIRNTRDRILVIQGAAGSGKTSVALHRIAYLLYHDRKRLRSTDIVILSPNSVFSDYISHILPELGEEPVRELSFDLFAWKELQDTVADCRDRYHYLETLWTEKSGGVDTGISERCRAKQSREFVRQVEGFLIELEDRLVQFEPVEFHGLELSEGKLLNLFYFKFQEEPLLSRMDAVREYFTDEFETLRGRDITEEEQLELEEKFRKQYVITDLYEIYRWFLEEYGYPSLPEVPREKRILEYEDVYPLLYLKYRLCRITDHKNVKHLVIDEMQDYSYLQYVILSRIFSCRMTILGDRAQTLEEQEQDVTTFLPQILGRDLRQIELRKSYRNTVEIAEYAGKITGVTDLELLERHGKPVEEQNFSGMKAALEEAVQHVNIGEDGYETAAVLTMTEAEALEAVAVLKELGLQPSYIDRDSSAFSRGLTVTTYYLAKGLEFDQVFTLSGTRKEDGSLIRQAEYISATRALHELYMYRLTDR